MTERTRLPVAAGKYRYHPTGTEWWVWGEPGEKIVVRLVHEDGRIWISRRGFHYAYGPGTFPGTFTKLED